MHVPSFADIGKQAKDLLGGSKKGGTFQYNHQLVINAKASDGVSAAVKAVKKESGLDLDIKGALKKEKITLDAHPMKKELAVTLGPAVWQGAKFSVSSTVPKLQTTSKVTAEYAAPYINTKASMSLNANPVVDLSFVTGYSGVVVGAKATADVLKHTVGSWDVAAAYLGRDFVVSAHSGKDLSTVRGSYWQQLDPFSSVGAEVVHSTPSNKVNLEVGYCLVTNSGDLNKVKINNEGKVHVHYEFKPKPHTTLATSVCVNLMDLAAEPKIGFAVDHSP